MTPEQIKERIAPCGLHCGGCFAFVDGDIKKSSQKLKYALGNFDVYAKRFVELLDEPVFNKYSDFNKFLSYLSTEECKGCRKENCKILKSCKVRECHQRKKVDFCYECSDFPCNDTGFDEHLHKRSVAINKRIQEVGLKKYYEEIKDIPRY